MSEREPERGWMYERIEIQIDAAQSERKQAQKGKNEELKR
jgi:hypothetical protein